MLDMKPKAEGRGSRGRVKRSGVVKHLAAPNASEKKAVVVTIA
jgi:hypothetical protein